MPKVMIVDDEYMLLRGLKLLIDWTALGLTIVKTEQNPLRALDYLQTHPVDILLSDMNMPEMDGPAFVAAAKKRRPELALIVISGYDDFDYVRAGLQQNAVNYLRKPIDTDELIEALQQAMARLKQQQKQRNDLSLAHQMQSRTLLTTTDEAVRAQASDSLAIVFDGRLPVRLIGILNPMPPEDLTQYLDQQDGVKGYFREGRDYMIIFQGSESMVNQFISQAPHRIGAARRPFLIGLPLRHLADVAESYQRLTHETKRQYFFETAAGLRLMVNEDAKQDVTLPKYSEVKQRVGQLDHEALSGWLDEQFELLKQQEASDVLTRQFALIVLLVLSDRLSEFSDKAMVINAINHAPDVSTLKQILLDTATLATRAAQQRYSRNIAAMRQIIQVRYAEPLTLTSVAAELHLNPVYLGHRFKQEVGKTFAQYLNDYRVGVAVTLLRQSHEDVVQIAQEIGYQNPSYFYKLFKQQMGMSPREYRETGGVAT